MQWDYKIITFELITDSDLEFYGKQGWELVSVIEKQVHGSVLTRCYFKRPNVER